MATKKQIDANRLNSRNSPGPRDTTKTKHNATKHSLYSAGITDLDKAEGFDELFANLIAQHHPVGELETFRVYCMARSVIRQVRAHRLESQFLETVLQPRFHDSQADDNSASESKRPTVEYGITSQLAPSVLEIVVTRYHRCEAFYETHLSRSERDLERLQRIRFGEQLPAPFEVAVTVHSDAEMVESVSNVNGSNNLASPSPTTIAQGSCGTHDSRPETNQHAGDVSAGLEPHASRTEPAGIGEEGSAHVSPSPEADIAVVNAATHDSSRNTEESPSANPTEDLGVVTGLQNAAYEKKPGPTALWQKISPSPLWAQENKTKPNS